MKIINKWLFGGSERKGIMLFPFAISGSNDPKLVKHESIHFYQALKTGLWLWYLPYFYYALKYGYTGNPYEIEAWVNQHNKDYKPTMLSHRKYIGKTRELYFKGGIDWSNRMYRIKKINK